MTSTYKKRHSSIKKCNRVKVQRKQKTVNNKCVVSKKVKNKSKYRYNTFSNTNCKSIYNYSLSLDPDQNLDQQPDPDLNLDQQLDLDLNLDQQLDPDLSLDQQ